jgi:hypothetical protein
MKKAGFFAWWGIACISFALGFYLRGRWYWAPGLLGWALVWLIAWERHASLCLGASVLLGAIGILLSVPAAPMIIGTTASLGLWDLASATWEDYRRSRLRYSLLALGLGALVAIVGLGIRLSLPFFFIFFCVLAWAFCIDRVARRLLKRNVP